MFEPSGSLSRGSSLWAGTSGGLARLDKDGHWQTYTRANTNGALPNDNVLALAATPASWTRRGFSPLATASRT